MYEFSSNHWIQIALYAFPLLWTALFVVSLLKLGFACVQSVFTCSKQALIRRIASSPSSFWLSFSTSPTSSASHTRKDIVVCFFCFFKLDAFYLQGPGRQTTMGEYRGSWVGSGTWRHRQPAYHRRGEEQRRQSFPLE
jgi:hypothetical protein